MQSFFSATYSDIFYQETEDEEDEYVEEKKQKKQPKPKKQNVETDAKECICEVCNRKLKNPSCLPAHMRTHTGER